MRGQGAIALGDGGIAFGAKVPDGGRVFDEEGEAARVQQRKHPFGIGPNGIAHCLVQAVVDVGQDQVEVRLLAARDSKNRRRDLGSARAPNTSSGSKPACRWNSARTSAFMGVKRLGLAMPSRDRKSTRLNS